MSVAQVELVREQAAHALLDDPRFLARWQALFDECSYATAFQAPGFVRSWYGAYRGEWQPVILYAAGEGGRLAGLWLLAFHPGTGDLSHAGTHQAEYHVWLARPGDETAFLAAAWAELKRRLTFHSLRFKYLPTATLGATLQSSLAGRGEVVVRKRPRPLLQLDPDEIRATFAKKSNRSRMNRLKRLGEVEFRRITDPRDLEGVFDDLIAFYDFRQAAVNGTAPFREDPRKRDFHKRVHSAAPDQTCVTATFLNGRPIAGFWGAVSGTTVHLGMLIHSPFLSEHSPGKLHVMQLSEHLLQTGKTTLDLTPGGDPWKERFANGHDECGEAVVYRSAWSRRMDDALEGVRREVKRGLVRARVDPALARAALARLRRAKPDALLRKVRDWFRTDREFRVYRGDRALAGRYRSDERVRRNSLSDLLAFEPSEPWQTRDGFLRSALERLERGEVAYTVAVDQRLAHSGWLVPSQAESYMTEVRQTLTLPDGSAALYDFYSHPEFRGRGLYRATLGHMLQDVFAPEGSRYAYISVLADNLPSRRVIETMGFEYQGSFFWSRRLGSERKWASPSMAAPEDAHGA